MSVSQALATPVDVTVESMALVPRNGFDLEPRCRVCRNDLVRKKVNDMLAGGSSYAMVLRVLGEDNDKLDTCDRMTIDSIRNHCGRHFPVQNACQGNLPGDPRTPRSGEPIRLRRGRGHRAHAHCVLRDGHGEKL